MCEKFFNAFAVGKRKNHNHHNLARTRRSDYQVPHQSQVSARVVELISVGDTELPHGQPYGIRRLGLQPTFLHVHNLVEHPGDMKP